MSEISQSPLYTNNTMQCEGLLIEISGVFEFYFRKLPKKYIFIPSNRCFNPTSQTLYKKITKLALKFFKINSKFCSSTSTRVINYRTNIVTLEPTNTDCYKVSLFLIGDPIIDTRLIWCAFVLLQHMEMRGLMRYCGVVDFYHTIIELVCQIGHYSNKILIYFMANMFYATSLLCQMQLIKKDYLFSYSGTKWCMKWARCYSQVSVNRVRILFYTTLLVNFLVSNNKQVWIQAGDRMLNVVFVNC